MKLKFTAIWTRQFQYYWELLLQLQQLRIKTIEKVTHLNALADILGSGPPRLLKETSLQARSAKSIQCKNKIEEYA